MQGRIKQISFLFICVGVIIFAGMLGYYSKNWMQKQTETAERTNFATSTEQAQQATTQPDFWEETFNAAKGLVWNEAPKYFSLIDKFFDPLFEEESNARSNVFSVVNKT